MDMLEHSLASLVQGANAVSRPVAFTLHLCFGLTYAAHLYRHRHDWARGPWARSLLFFPLQGGNRHAVFQVFAWGLWGLSAAITLPVYLSLLAAGPESRAEAASVGPRGGLLGLLGLRRPLIPLTHVDAASGAAAVSSLWGELFLLKALLVFEGSARLGGGVSGKQSPRKGTKAGRRKADHAQARERDQAKERGQQPRSQQQLLAGPLASLLVCLMGMALSITGFVLLLALEHMPDTASRVLYCCLALSCVFIGASSTHGLGGHLRHCAGAASSAGAAVLRGGGPASSAAAAAAALPAGQRGAGDPEVADPGDTEVAGPSWRFFQPFQGGSVFVATQAIGWTLFSSTVVAVLLLAKQLVAGVGYCLRCWALTAGALMMATQLVLGVSILTYQTRRTARQLLQPVLHHPRDSFARAAGLVMPVVMMYLPLHFSCSAIAAAFALLPLRQAAAAVAAVLVPYFVITLRGHPAHSGCRRWEWLCRWFSREVEGSLAFWAGRLVVIRDFPGTAHEVADELERQRGEGPHHHQLPQLPQPQPSQQLSQSQQQSSQQHRRRYVLGFHPHGLYPTGAGFLPLMPSVHAALPGTTIVTLTASIVHYLPGLRDIAGWAGFRQVTRATFRRALRDTGAVLLCPGGQAELVYADRALPPRGSPAAAAAAAAASTAASAAKASPHTALEVAAAGGGGDEKTRSPAGAAGGGGPEGSEASATGLGLRPSSPEPVPRPVGRQPRQRHQLVLYAGHQGFVRLALEEGAWLVPVLALGETLQLRNLISAPELQRATYKRLGFPVPFILAGRWGLTTLPLRNPLVYIIGRPLQPPAGWERQRQRQLLGLGPEPDSAKPHGAAPLPPPPRDRSAGGGDEGGQGAAGQQPRTSHFSTGSSPGGGGGDRGGKAGARHRRQQGRRGASGGIGSPPAEAKAAGGGEGPAAPTAAPAGGLVAVPQALVDEYHSQFYRALEDLWRRHQHQHPVLRHAELVVEWGKHAPPSGSGQQQQEG